MRTENKCPKHDRFLFLVCDEERCGECEEEFLMKNPPPPPPKRVCVPVWDQHHGKWDLSNSVPARR